MAVAGAMAGITGYLITGCMVDSDGARVRSSYPEVHRCLLCCPCTSHQLSLPAVLPMTIAWAAHAHRIIHRCRLCSAGGEGLLWDQRRGIRGDSSDFKPPMCRSRILGMRSRCCWHDISVQCRCYLVRQWILCTRLRIVMLLAISISGSGH